jgi:hypothetical protein
MSWRERLFSNAEQSFSYKSPELASGEAVQGSWYGARTFAGKPGVGGRVALTNDSLVFEPVDVDAPRTILSTLARATGVPGVGVANRVIDDSRLLEPMTVPLSQVQSVEPLPRQGLFRPPQARVQTTEGDIYDFGFVRSPLTPNVSKGNVAVRDDWVRQIQSLSGKR